MYVPLSEIPSHKCGHCPNPKLLLSVSIAEMQHTFLPVQQVAMKYHYILYKMEMKKDTKNNMVSVNIL